VNLSKTIYTDNNQNTLRASCFALSKKEISLKSFSLETEAGIRGQYWTFNKQFLISPRMSVLIDPEWKRDFRFRIAGGIYYQPAFYKEIRDENGVINQDIKTQRSIHLVAGSILDFSAWNRPFRFSSDIYYKSLNNIIPYKIDNVRIIYSGKNNAKGYAAGIDFRVNGEFVEGVESWTSLKQRFYL